MAVFSFPCPQMEAHQWLHALGGACHGHEDQSIDVADDGVGCQCALADDSKNGVVKKKNDQTVGELVEALGQAQGQNAAISGKIQLEPPHPQPLPVGEKVAEKDTGGRDLGETRGQRRAPHTPQ